MDTYFEIAPVSLQSRWGIFFSHIYWEYHEYYIFKILKKIREPILQNRNQLGPPYEVKQDEIWEHWWGQIIYREISSKVMYMDNQPVFFGSRGTFSSSAILEELQKTYHTVIIIRSNCYGINYSFYVDLFHLLYLENNKYF